VAEQVGFVMDEAIFQSTNGSKNADIFRIGLKFGPA